ncbi:MAG: exodeoxyribonuclease III [Candidatus Paceibacterota bacterium]
MKLISWNVNGLRALHRKELLYPFLEQYQPDIFCIQETKSHIEQLSKDIIEIPGYASYFESGIRKGYSGVAIYSKIQPKSIQTGFQIDDIYDREGRIQIADYENFILINIYFPNGGSGAERLSYKLKFYEALLQYLENIDYTNKKIIITGDVNTAHTEIDLARPKENKKVSGFLPQERAWLDKLTQQYGFTDTLRVFTQEGELYTWWDMKTRARDRNVGWRIDYFFVSQMLKNKVKNAYILSDEYGSDQCPVVLELEI